MTVVDTTPPTITLTTQPITLWSPDHKYRTINMTDLVSSVSDNCGNVSVSSVVIPKVTSDEPENAPGNSDDLRNGRVYTITLNLKDASNNTATATRKVTVPLSQNGSPAVEDAPQYTVTCQ